MGYMMKSFPTLQIVKEKEGVWSWEGGKKKWWKGGGKGLHK